jgi:gliding motility-associated-like protein
VSNTASATYTFTPDAGQCAATTSISIIVNPVGTSITDIAICDKQLPYLWNGQSFNASGTYSVNLTSASGCDSIATLVLTASQVLTSSTQLTICNNELPYQWNNQSFNSAGTYSVNLVSAAGCDSIATVVLAVRPTPTSTTELTVCEKQLPYSWNGNTFSLPGTYTVKLISSEGCDSIATLILNTSNVLTSTTITNICSSQVPYSWNGQSYSESGAYNIKLTSSAGCDSIANLILTVRPLPTVSISAPESICMGSKAPITVQLTGSAPWSISYTDGTAIKVINNINSSTFTFELDITAPTTIAVISVTDANCTNGQALASVVVNATTPVQSVRLPEQNTFAFIPIQLNARNLGDGYTYQWSPGEGVNSSTITNPVFANDRTVEYLIRMTSEAGCETVDTLRVVVKSVNANATPDLLVPNAWTPNGDGQNDQIMPYPIKIKELVYFRVFNRWGQLMYETTELGKGWNGYYKGKIQPIDAYVWTVKGIGIDGTVITKSGNAALLR